MQNANANTKFKYAKCKMQMQNLFQQNISPKFPQGFPMDFQKFWLGPKGPTVAAEGCSPPQVLEKAAHRAAIFLVYIRAKLINYKRNDYVNSSIYEKFVCCKNLKKYAYLNAYIMLYYT